METISRRSCYALLLACLAFPAAPARALDLTGTWSITGSTGAARCKVVEFAGGSQSTLAFLGPLQISRDAQRPIFIHLRSGPGDDIGYQGVEAPEPPSVIAGQRSRRAAGHSSCSTPTIEESS